jgi:L-lactate utilization protein LutC
MAQFDVVADQATITATADALTANGFRVTIVENGDAAKIKALELLPKGAEVHTVTSVTSDTIGLTAAINESDDYDAVWPKLMALYGDPANKREQRRLGAAPDYVVGSVHALTQDGHALIASKTGSQLPPYAFGAGHVIWVVGAQKIVKNIDEAWQRLEQHVFPLENARSQQAYGSGSSINKVLVYNKEALPERVDIIIIKETVGF